MRVAVYEANAFTYCVMNSRKIPATRDVIDGISGGRDERSGNVPRAAGNL